MRLLIMGPPGVGKGTQAKILSEKLNVIHLSTGEILRGEIQKDTKIGKIAKSFIDQGNLVPDDFILEIISKQISANVPNEGYLLDGFPRTIYQANEMNKILTKYVLDLTATIALDVDDNLLKERLLKRGKISGRADDQSVDKILTRLNEYRKKTQPLIKYYEK